MGFALIIYLGSYRRITAAASEPLMWKNPVIAFHNGDSGVILDAVTGTIEEFRIDGYAAPETSEGRAGCERERRHGIIAAARANTFALATPIVVEWSDENKDGQIDRDHDGKGLLKVWQLGPNGQRGRDLYNYMIGPKLALPSEGGKRPDWCKFLDRLLKQRLKDNTATTD